MFNRSKSIFSTALLSSVLFITACSDTDTANLPDEFEKATNLLDGKWDAGCLENPPLASNPDAPTGYVRETLEFSSLTATQTFEYFQDANCTLPVTSSQVANDNETFFLRKQSQVMSIDYPKGKISTDLGDAYYLDLQVISVSIDDAVQTDEQLQQLGITLNELLGLYIVTESDRLHINAATDARPTTVPLDYFYDRATD